MRAASQPVAIHTTEEIIDMISMGAKNALQRGRSGAEMIVILSKVVVVVVLK